MRILVVDDSAGTRAFIRGALEAVGVELELQLVEASGGFEALRLLPRGPYQLVITDINMGDINGLEILSFIRSSGQHPDTRVLLISTQASKREQERGLALGADAFLAKPFSAEQLQLAVRSLLVESRAHG
jgi:two-component system, chemotaxis family, chemotaxis protein CheY